MSSPLEIYNDILFLELRPWLQKDVSELKFKQDLNDLQKVHYQFQPLYEVTFPKALTHKRKYYQVLIDDQAITYLNRLHQSVADGINENAKKYHVHMALTRTIHEMLNEIARVIKERKYTPEQYDPKYEKLPDDMQLSDEAFILDYLKHSAVRLFLEIQDTYPEMLKNEKLEEDDIYLIYFNHSAPNPTHMAVAEKISTATPLKYIEAQEKQPDFKPVTYDFRPEVKGVLSYAAIVKTPSRFSMFESKLNEQGYINKQYEFTDNHGMRNELAIIYHHLINKGYFNKRRFPGNKEIKDLDIRKFLDHRYNTNIDKQFRNYRKEPDKIAAFVDAHHWLYNLPFG